MWQAEAPSNIALIKYMGKIDATQNIPTNTSFSYTLPHLTTTVRLTESTHDHWQPLDEKQIISEAGQARFLKFLNKLKAEFDYQGYFCVESANNFPTGAGIASSASSFAALTMAANQALSSLTGKPALSIEQASQLSRTGSGSSIRSFYQPWALWRGQSCQTVELPYSHLIHQVILIESTPKKISSSEAHQLIQTSPLFAKRLDTIEAKLDNLITALQKQDWQQSYEIVLQEFLEMHELFHTCEKPFTYMQDTSWKIIDEIKSRWHKDKDGPMITMDAGPNIHLLYRPDQSALAEEIKAFYSLDFHVR